MNYIYAKVSSIQESNNITIVSFEAGETNLKMMSLSLNTNIKVGTKVKLGVKASSIALCKNLSGMISISNKLDCSVASIREGDLLCSIKLSFNETTLESITTKDSALNMEIKQGENIIALIKASELSILEILS